KFVLSDFCEALPADRVVLELIGRPEIDDTVLQRLKHLASSGFDIAVGEFALSERFRSLLDIAAIVKFDVSASDWPHNESLIAHIDRKRIKLAAERVETGDQFRFCKNAGVDYFQGYYFCKPEIVRATRLPLSRLMTLRLIGRLHDPNVT